MKVWKSWFMDQTSDTNNKFKTSLSMGFEQMIVSILLETKLLKQRGIRADVKRLQTLHQLLLE
jgi:hypothetical protein